MNLLQGLGGVGAGLITANQLLRQQKNDEQIAKIRDHQIAQNEIAAKEAARAQDVQGITDQEMSRIGQDKVGYKVDGNQVTDKNFADRLTEENAFINEGQDASLAKLSTTATPISGTPVSTEDAIKSAGLALAQKGYGKESLATNKQLLDILKATHDEQEIRYKTKIAPVAHEIQSKQLKGELDMVDPKTQTAVLQVNGQLQDAQEKSMASLYGMAKNGNMNGAIEGFNSSQLLYPGTKAANMVHVPAKGDQPAMVALVDDKGQVVKDRSGRPLAAPESYFSGIYTKHFSPAPIKLNAGDELVSVSADKKSATKVYRAEDKEQWAPAPENSPGSINKKTGEFKPGAAGLGSVPTRKVQDERVKMAIDKVIVPKYGGKFEGGMFFPDEKNKDVAIAAQVKTEQYIKQGADPVDAASRAIKEVEREAKLGALTTGNTPSVQPKKVDVQSIMTNPN